MDAAQIFRVGMWSIVLSLVVASACTIYPQNETIDCGLFPFMPVDEVSSSEIVFFDSILTCSDIQHIHSTSEGSILAILDVILRYPRTVADGAAQNGFVGVLAVWNTVFNEQSLVRSGW